MGSFIVGMFTVGAVFYVVMAVIILADNRHSDQNKCNKDDK